MDNISSPQELVKQGKDAYRRGDYQAAASYFEASRHAFSAAGDELNAAESANNCSVAYLHAGEAEAALKEVEGTAETFAQAGDIRRQGMAIGNYAAALEAVGRLEEAASAYQESADLLQQAGEDQLHADVMRSLSSLQFKMGRQLQALATMQTGIEGVKHPTVAQRLTKKLLRIPIDMVTKNKP